MIVDEGSQTFKWLYIKALLGASPLHPHPRLLGIALISHADPDGGNCFPSLALVAEMLKLSEQAIHRWIRVLHEAGWLDVVPFCRAGDRQSASLYVFSIPDDFTRKALRGALRWDRRKRGYLAPPDHHAWKNARCRKALRDQINR